MYYGQFNTDQVIETYFPKDYIGTAIDVGAVDGKFISNTLYFEERGWDVLCIEANPVYYDELIANRKNVLCCAVANYIANDVTFHGINVSREGYSNDSSVSALKIDQELLRQHKENHGLTCKEYEYKVPVRTLDHCIVASINFNVQEKPIDFVSIDVEGGELDVLRGFNLTLWNPKLFVIEANSYDQHWQIRNYMSSFGYKLDQRLEVNDFYVRE